MLKRMWREDEGVLTFEWILLITLLVIGTVGAVSGVRDAINSELVDVAGAIISLDQSYSVCSPVQLGAGVGSTACCYGGAVGSSYERPQPYYSSVRVDGATPVKPGSCP